MFVHGFLLLTSFPAAAPLMLGCILVNLCEIRKYKNMDVKNTAPKYQGKGNVLIWIYGMP
jgi:hypothetical protein